MPNLEAFRQETRAWLKANAPASMFGTRVGFFGGYWGGRRPEAAEPDILLWMERMVERGWTAPGWPREYGGGGLSPAEAAIVEEELQGLALPPPLVGFGLAMLGPVLLRFGSEAQRQEYLPPICRGEIRWCQGYSEPGAGSDLASLNTRALRAGDDFVLNGQKVWTSYADESDWIFCLVRTDSGVKKQAGISFILADMESPGVTASRIPLISGASPFCEVFFEDVRVPASQVVHEVNAGWTVAKALLGHERTAIGAAIGDQLARAEGELVALARRHLRQPSGPLEDALIRDAIAREAMSERCFKYTLDRVQQGADAGHGPGAQSSVIKITGSELKQRRWELACRIAGPDALGWEGPGFDEEHLAMVREWLRSRANTIEGGTSEIQLNIIAKRVLGLPSG